MSRELDFADGFTTTTPSSAIPLLASEVTNLPTGNLAGTTVQTALNELQSDIDTRATSTALSLHEADTTAIHGIADTAVLVTLAGVQTLTGKTLTSPTINTPTGIVKSDVGLANVDNTSDATKNAAIATLTNKTLTTPVITAPTGIVKADVGLSLVDNTSDATKNAAAVVLTNKDIDGGTASNTSRITLPKAAKTTLDALTRKAGTILFDTTSGKPYYDDGTNLQLVGSGSGGGVNFVTNSDGSTGTTGYIEGSYAAAARPAGAFTASSGVGAFVVSTSTVAPIGTAATSLTFAKSAGVSRQGRAVEYEFDLSIGYRAKVLQTNIQYIINSGAFVAGVNGTTPSDSSLIWYASFFNGTTWTLSEPSSFKLLSTSTTISDVFSSTIQSPSDATKMRLIAYVAESVVSAWEVKAIISVSPSVYVYGTPVTDWASFTPTVSPISGYTLSPIGYQRRVGDEREYVIQFRKDGSTGTGATSLLFTLPNGASVDFTKLNTNSGTAIVGVASTYGQVSASAWDDALPVVVSTATEVAIANPGSASVYLGTGVVASSYWNLKFTVPIVGLSSSVQMSDQTDTRVVSLNASVATGTLSGAFNVIKFTTVAKDTHGSYSAATGLWTCIVPGDYLLSSSVEIVGTGVANAVEGIRIKKGAGSIAANILTIATVNNAFAYSASAGVTLAAGDTVSVDSFTNRTTPSFPVTNTNSNFSVSRISGPSAIAASSSVNAIYTTAAGQSIPNATFTIIDFGTREEDNHGFVTTGAAWKFQPSIGGLFEISAKCYLSAGGGWNVNEEAVLDIYKNNVSHARISGYVATVAHASAVSLDGVPRQVRLNSGEFADIRLYQSTGAALAIVASSQLTWISIKRVGN